MKLDESYKENLTVGELLKFQELFTEAVNSELKTLIEIEKKGEFGKVAYHEKVNYVNYFEIKDDFSESLLNCGVEETLEIIEDFKSLYEPHKEKYQFFVDQIIEYESGMYDESQEVSEIFWRASWKEVKTEIPESGISYPFRKYVESWIKPENASYKKTIDCKLLALFKDGMIDWATLRKLVYSDCEL